MGYMFYIGVGVPGAHPFLPPHVEPFINQSLHSNPDFIKVLLLNIRLVILSACSGRALRASIGGVQIEPLLFPMRYGNKYR